MDASENRQKRRSLRLAPCPSCTRPCMSEEEVRFQLLWLLCSDQGEMTPDFLLAVSVLASFIMTPVGASNRPETAVLLLKAENASPVFFCTAYVPAVKDVPKKEEDSEYRPFLNVLNDTDCDYERRSFEGKLVMLERCDNTSNDDVIQQAKSAKATGVLISVNAMHAAEEMKTDIKKLDIIAGFVLNTTAQRIARYDDRNNQSLMGKLFATQTSFDWSFVVIWAIAMGTVVGGSYWSGLVQRSQYEPKVTKPKKKTRRASKSSQKAADADANVVSHASMPPPVAERDFTESMAEMDDEFTVPLSPKLVVMFVIHMSVMLLVLYYFYRYLAYLIIIMFGLASAAALMACLEPLVNRINIGTSKIPKALAVGCQTPIEWRQAALVVFSFGVALAWFLTRQNDIVGWALQDVLGIAFCINMLKSIHLPNLKLLCLLLSLLLVYDVFFVFITPIVRASRESVMVEVAKGGSLQEGLPMVVRFPRLVKGKYYACFKRKYSILGLGDILAPGLLLSYCHAFDLLSLGRRFYFYISCTSYGVGMLLTFMALQLMRIAQPALLYLVPCTILPTVLTAWYKGHLFAIWNGLRLPPTKAAPAVEAAEDNPVLPDRKTPDNSETEQLIREEPADHSNVPRDKKTRRRKRSRRTSESGTKSAAGGGGGKEVVAAEGDDVRTARNALLLDAAERLMRPSPSALPLLPRTMSGGAEDCDGVRKRSPASILWEEPLVVGALGVQGGGQAAEQPDAPKGNAASPFSPA
ncbi:signal peptide peptidase-like 2B [Amblyomma americanum]